MRDQYMRTGQGFVLVYDITSRKSFEEVIEFREQILRVKDVDNCPMVIVGNKCDLEALRQVTTTEGKDLAKSFGSAFEESSAKARINVEESFYELVRCIRKDIAKSDKANKNGTRKFKNCKLL